MSITKPFLDFGVIKMIKKTIFLILMFQVVYSDLLQFYNFSRIPQDYQPLGSINSNHIFYKNL